jgi:molybdopterin-guanine dinucleotide biosynthesis protein A
MKTAAILAGGRSRRMGADKALLAFAGIPMLERAVRTASEVCSRLLVLGRDRAPEAWPAALKVEWWPDAAGPGEEPQGPMPALMAALARAAQPLLLVACDMPLLTAGTLRLLLDAHRSEAAATVATSRDSQGGEFVEPALAVYAPACIPILRKLLETERGSFQGLKRLPQVRRWPVPEERAIELSNVNTPEALRRALEAYQARSASGGFSAESDER